MVKPKPKPTNVVCSECGLQWDDHTKEAKEPTADVCIRLLKAELEKRPRTRSVIWNGGTGITYPWGTLTNS